jgi:2-(1,2-epoxy-1,2-dihydrophenyl)acetyl-CoA isomerase
MSDPIRLERMDGVATITLDRPDALNAFAGDMRERLADALDAVAADDATRVLVVTGAGRAFCAGGDVRHMAGLAERGEPFEALAPLLDAGRAVITRLEALPIPTIAAVNGVAAGAGLNLALACDLRFASRTATFAASFVRIGLHPDWGGSWFLPRRVGIARALELCWTGEPVAADQAYAIGLVERVIEPEALAAETRAFAARLARAPQASVRAIKRTLRASLERTLDQALDAEVEAQRACWRTPDVAEGLRAFVEKRAPAFGPKAGESPSE